MPNIKERPILFSGEMVRAILEGRKTQTRRVVKPQPPPGEWRYDGLGNISNDDGGESEHHWLEGIENGKPSECYESLGKCPYGIPGDRLWVREAWRELPSYDKDGNATTRIDYKADGKPSYDAWPWRPSIHMYRQDSRITLEVAGIRVERLQKISQEDALREGVRNESCNFCHHIGGSGCECCGAIYDRFISLWDSISKPGAKWHDNPWVWVIDFRRVENA